MRPLPFALLLAACAQTPQPSAPERAEPVPRATVAATVAGTIHHAAHGEAGFAAVTLLDGLCARERLRDRRGGGRGRARCRLGAEPERDDAGTRAARRASRSARAAHAR